MVRTIYTIFDYCKNIKCTVIFFLRSFVGGGITPKNYLCVFLVYGLGNRPPPPPSLYLALFFQDTLMSKVIEKSCYSSDFGLQVPV